MAIITTTPIESKILKNDAVGGDSHNDRVYIIRKDVTMDFEVILSGKEKVQVLDNGFRLKWNKGPQGPHETSYFTCVTPGCRATAATLGPLEKDRLTLKYHRVEQHIHHADPHTNLSYKVQHQFRENAKSNPDSSAKANYERIQTEIFDSIDSPSKEDLAAKMPKTLRI